MKNYSLLVAAALLGASAAPAAGQAQTPTTDAQSEFKAADAAMNRELESTRYFMKRRDTADRAGKGNFAVLLLDSQRAWLKFRDTQCTIEAAEFSGGSLAATARLVCLAALTRARAKQLGNLRWHR